MTDDEKEIRIRDAIKRGDIDGNAEKVAYGIFRTWRTGKELSSKQEWWLNRLVEMSKAEPEEPLIEPFHG